VETALQAHRQQPDCGKTTEQEETNLAAECPYRYGEACGNMDTRPLRTLSIRKWRIKVLALPL